MKARGDYRPMTKTGGPVFSVALARRCRLWQGSDHVLLVSNLGYTEEYKRFYYAAIQSIVVRRTRMHLLWAVLLGIPSVISLLTLFFLPRDGAGWGEGLLIVIAGFFLALFAVNLLRGPTCICLLRTAVHAERLYALTRWRAAMHFIEALRPLVEAAQGPLSPDFAVAWADAAPAPGTAAAATEPARYLPPRRPFAAPLRPYRSRAHVWLILILGIDLAHSAVQCSMNNMAIFLSGILILAGYVGALVRALRDQHRTDLGLGLKALPWAVLGYLAFMYMVEMVYYIAFIMQHPEAGQSTMSYMRLMSSVTPATSRARLVVLALSAAGAGTLAATGAVLWLLRTRTHRRPPGLPQEAPPLPR